MGCTAPERVVRSDLGDAYADMRSELSLTDSLVLNVFLLVAVLGVATIALVARVLSRRRAVELALVRSRGASAWQLARTAAVEALVLAAAAIAVAIPLSLAAYGELASSDRWSPSWASVATASPGIGPWLVLAVIAGAVVPSVVVVVTSLLAHDGRRRTSPSGSVTNAGIDLMLVVIAAVMYVQLRQHVVSPGAIDPMLVIAPATCAIALAALVARLLPVVGRAANAAARRARGIVVPVASWHVARGGATHGTFLVVLATAVGMFGVTFLGTWSASQAEQADAAVGADLVVAQANAPGMGARLATATGGSVIPVADDAVVLGTRPDGVRLVALDAGSAGVVVRGELPHEGTWAGAMDGLAPEHGTAALVLGQGPVSVTMTGAPKTGGAQSVAPTLVATPSFVLRDQWGDVATVIGQAAPLDGAPHVIDLALPQGRGDAQAVWSIVAVDLLMAEPVPDEASSAGSTKLSASISLHVSGATSSVGDWGAVAPGNLRTIVPGEVKVTGSTVAASFSYAPTELSWQDAHLILTSFPPSTEVPVAMTEQLARDLGLGPGDQIAMVKGTTTLDAVLVRTVPYVPSHVREDAVLADLNSLDRALLSAGTIGTLADKWWVDSPDAGAADALRAQGLGPVTTSEEEAKALRDGPVRVSLTFAWGFAVVAAVLLAATGAAALAAGEALHRTPTVARLRAIGVPRRAALASHLLQHAAVTVSAVALGVGIGAVLALLLAPLLVVAPGGQRAVPPASLVWSASASVSVAAAIAVSGLLVGVPAALAMVRRSTVAALRSGDAS